MSSPVAQKLYGPATNT